MGKHLSAGQQWGPEAEELMKNLKYPIGHLMGLYADGMTFKKVQMMSGLSGPEFWKVVRYIPEHFDMYSNAREFRAHVLVDNAHEASDKAYAGEVDARAAEVKIKMATYEANKSKTFAERQTVEHTGTVTHVQQLDDEELVLRLTQLMAVSQQLEDKTQDAITVIPERVEVVVDQG
jgi:hypothetical protein